MKKYHILLCFLLIVFISCQPTTTSKQKPNVVFFLVDDLGWQDVACFGSDFYQTPNVDKLAEAGVRFTNGYASCTVCSPTRASIMSGKYPATINCTNWIEGHDLLYAKLKIPEWTMYMDTAEYTMAEAFQDAGYVTGHFGKWHLGEEEMYWPENHGFDVNKGGWAKGSPNANKKLGYKGYFSPYLNPRLSDGPKGEHLTERLAEEACEFIDKNQDKPFFLNFWFYNVHTPIRASQDKIDKYTALVNPNNRHRNPVYAAMVEHMDDAIGKVMSQLEARGLTKNTIIVFASDNGGLMGRFNDKITSNYPLRDGKGQIYEGGVRVPNIIIAPGVSQEGKICETPMISMDYYPTLLELAGITCKKEVKDGLDGKSLVPLIKGKGNFNRDAIFWHYPHYHIEGAKPYSAIRKGDWKLIHNYDEDKFELYNLREDIGEKNNQFDKYPDKRKELQQDLETWKQKVGAQMPTSNPNYKPEKADFITKNK